MTKNRIPGSKEFVQAYYYNDAIPALVEVLSIEGFFSLGFDRISVKEQLVAEYLAGEQEDY